MFLYGITVGAIDTVWDIWILQNVSIELQGRVLGLLTVLFTFSVPLGFLFFTFILNYISLNKVFLFMGLFVIMGLLTLIYNAKKYKGGEMKMKNKEIKINKLSQKNALSIADWKYQGIYSFYDTENDVDDYKELISPELRQNNYFECTSSDELLGFFCIESSEKNIELGLGLHPKLVGRGYGGDFLNLIENYLFKEYNNIISLTLSVAHFNKRAIKVYERSGFVEIGREEMWSNGKNHLFIKMKKYL